MNITKSVVSLSPREAEARIAALELECAHKDKILSILSHDMRNPLLSLTSILSLLDAEQLPAEYQQAISIVQVQLDAICELLNNLLRWSAVGHCPAKAEHAAVNIMALARQNLNLVSAALLQKNITVVNKLPESVPVQGNSDQIDVVVRNVILNAVKFTPPSGNITLAHMVSESRLTLIISDSGIGMTEAQLGMVFTRQHLSTYGTNGERGYGIGLLLCKEYIDANNGTMTIESIVNKGTTIRVSLPLA